jgi:hypothetical protein
VSKGIILENAVKNNTYSIKVKKLEFYLNEDFHGKYSLLFIKAYLLMMTIMFFSIAYNRFTYFILIGTLLLSIFTIFKIKLDKMFKTRRTQRIAHYILLLVVVGITAYFIMKVTFDHSNVDSASSFISLIVQSEAAIIAIVVSLSLVAVQQTSSSYSARVINIFKDPKRNPDFFILMGTYAFCIIFGTHLQKTIKILSSGNTTVGPVFIFDDYLINIIKVLGLSNISMSSLFDIYIWILYAFFIFSLLALGSYILETLEMFKPCILIKLLSENIHKDSIESAIKLEKSNGIDENGKIQPIEDTIQPIIDVLQGSMMAYDYETARYGLRIIENKAIQILKDKNYDLTCKEAIAKRIIDYIKIVGVIAVKQDMERTAIDTSITLSNIGGVLIEEKLYTPIPSIIYSLKKIGKNSSTKDNLLDSSVQTINALQKIGKRMVRNNEKSIVKKTIDSVGEIGISAITPQNSEPSVLIDRITEVLEEFGKKVIEKKWEIETEVVITNLGNIGLKLIDKELITRDAELSELKLLTSLYSIAKVVIEEDLEDPIYDITSTIRNIGVKASDRKPYIVYRARNFLHYIHITLSPRCLDIVPENVWIKLCKHVSELEKEL